MWTSYTFDEESGLYYLNARFYDPELARFMQEDTYRGQRSDPLSLNLYTYCHNNPIRYWDPSGRLAAGDEDRPIEVQMELIALTNAYYAAQTKEEKDAIHQTANDVRSEKIQPQDYTYTKTDKAAVNDAQDFTNAFTATYFNHGMCFYDKVLLNNQTLTSDNGGYLVF